MKINNNVSFGSAAGVRFTKKFGLSSLPELDAMHFVVNVKKALPELGARSILHPKDRNLCLVVNNEDKMLLEPLLDSWHKAIMFNRLQAPSGAMNAATKSNKGIVGLVRSLFKNILKKPTPQLTESEKAALAATDKFTNAFTNIMIKPSTPKFEYQI